jgi:hypothetical protein
MKGRQDKIDGELGKELEARKKLDLDSRPAEVRARVNAIYERYLAAPNALEEALNTPEEANAILQMLRELAVLQGLQEDEFMDALANSDSPPLHSHIDKFFRKLAQGDGAAALDYIENELKARKFQKDAEFRKDQSKKGKRPRQQSEIAAIFESKVKSNSNISMNEMHGYLDTLALNRRLVADEDKDEDEIGFYIDQHGGRISKNIGARLSKLRKKYRIS